MLNKSALRNFATNARRELIERVELQARKIGITKDKIEEASVESSDAFYINGKQLSDIERKQRNKLIARIDEIGFERVIEETAYTWFNRFVALRFMEVNDYLPTRVRVLSSEKGYSTEPDMMKEALSLDLDIDKQYVYDLKMENNTDELFKYLIKLHCNDLNRYLPFMFETIEDYTAILFPEGLLGADSFVRVITDKEVIPEDNWEKIEIIGWIYQFYIEEEKDRVFKAKKKYKPEEIPFVTQLFTPDWIVQYMVQNSLGRYWMEAHPEHKDLTSKWQFYIEHQQEDFDEKIAPYINKELNVEEIKCFDPAMGSGHILVYMFDVLFEIYSKCGYMERDIPRLIIENNLYGLDIDDRAYQLACFSVVMKALEYNKRFLRSIERDGLQLKLVSIQETNNLSIEDIQYLAGENEGKTFDKVFEFIKQFKHAKTIGSLLKVDSSEINTIKERLNEVESKPVENWLDDQKREKIIHLIPELIRQVEIMEQQYEITVTNPPYMNPNNNKELSDYVKKNYPDSKSDLFAAFMEIEQNLKKNGFYAMINQHSWMFLSSYEKLRMKIIENKFIDTMLHLGPRTFEEIGGEVVQSTAYIMRNSNVKDINGTYFRLVDERTAADKRLNTIAAIKEPTVSIRYKFYQENFNKIPGNPIAYWISKNIINAYVKGDNLGLKSTISEGIKTGNNKKFLKYWFEIDENSFSFGKAKVGYKWYPHHKGGEFRKWYGNMDWVINWKNNGEAIKNASNSGLQGQNMYFKEVLSCSKVTKSISIRFIPKNSLFDSGSPTLRSTKNMLYYAGVINSHIGDYVINYINPTMNIQVGNLKAIPIILNESNASFIENMVKNNITISKDDWDSFETSWDFEKHPLLKFSANSIEISFKQWDGFAEKQFYQLKENEEELNRIFIETYGLQDELTPDVDEKDVTVRKADLERDIKSFISYAVGCTFGRYSLDEDGLIYAGGEFDPTQYKTFPADDNNILPILPGAYFEDDIVTRFIEFVKVTYGSETLEENLQFVADAIGRRKNETAREAIRRYFLNNFYKDHIQTYKKHPIYWLFTSGKEKAFNCLIYMHRYDKTTLSRIRTDYLHDVQTRYESMKQDLHSVIEGDGTAKEIRDARRDLRDVEKKIGELKKYDEKLHHMADMQIEIDLDDGVKVNYKKFEGLVAKI